MADLLIEHATALLPEGPRANTSIVVRDGRIVAVDGPDTSSSTDGAERIDASGLLVAAGLIELQINGGFGHDFTEQPGSIWEVGALLAAHGVTAFLPTLVSPSRASVDRARRALLDGPPPGFRGAWPLGLHLEGPFINPAAAGAHDRSAIRRPDAAELRAWRHAGGVALVTLAPELPGALEAASLLAQAGVIVAAGHSHATHAQAEEGIAAGIRYATHLFNAMLPLGHRDPGLVGAMLDDERVTVGLIPDAVHVHPAIVRLVRRIVGRRRLSAVTDAVAALGMAAGGYRLDGRDIRSADGTVRLADGTLAGSALAPDEALRRLQAMTSCPAEEAVGAMTAVPAVLLGIDRERGVLRPGARADLVLLSPALDIAATFVAGERLHG